MGKVEHHRTFVYPKYYGKGKWYAATGDGTCLYCGTVIHFKESTNQYRAMTGQYDVCGKTCLHFIGLARPRGHSGMVLSFHQLGKTIYPSS